jgi:hypothetical protein
VEIFNGRNIYVDWHRGLFAGRLDCVHEIQDREVCLFERFAGDYHSDTHREEAGREK